MESLMYFCKEYGLDESVAICTRPKNNLGKHDEKRWFTWRDGKVTVSTESSSRGEYSYSPKDDMGKFKYLSELCKLAANLGGIIPKELEDAVSAYYDTDKCYLVAPRAMGKNCYRNYLKMALNSLYGSKPWIIKIIFSGPVTIVFWSDGDKTIVKRRDGEYDDKEKAVLAAIAKKFLGDNKTRSNYLDKIKPYYNEAMKRYDKEQSKKEDK